MFPVQYEGYQWEQLTRNIKFASKVHLGVRAKLGLPRGLQYPSYRGANQADVCYCIHLQVDMGANIGMYNGGSVDIAFSSIRTTT